MKKILLCIVPLSALLLTSAQGAGVMSFPVGPLTFDNVASPTPTNGWSTLNVTGAGNTWTTANAALEPAVQALTSAGINLLLPQSNTQPPSTSGGGFRYNYGGFFLQSRPTGDAGVVLMGTFQNDSGSAQNVVRLSYDFAIQTILAGELPGWEVYYSLTGAANSWTKIPELSGNVTVGNQTVDVTLTSAWGTGQPLYIMWVDDNADGVTDESYTMDNFSLQATTCVPPTIETQPHSIVTGNCLHTNLTVVAVGTSLTYQWFHNGGPISGATSASLTFSNTTGADIGTYKVTVTGTCGSPIDSDTVSVTVNQDPPTTTSAVVHCDRTTATVIFSQAMDITTAQQADAYTLFPLDGGDQQTATGAVLGLGSTGLSNVVTLTLGAPITAAKNYELVIGPNVSDCAGNGITPLGGDNQAHVPVKYELCLLSMTNTQWRIMTNGVDQGTDWRRDDQGFDDSGWPTGIGAFDGKTGTTANRTTIGGVTVNTFLSLVDPNWTEGDIPAYYFRTHFDMPTALQEISSLQLITLSDDFDVAWLNNPANDLPWHVSPGLPAGTNVDQFYFGGGSAVGDASRTTFNVDPSQLKYGANFIAAKIFQSNMGSSDITFAYDLIATVNKFVVPVTLSIVLNGANVNVTWTDSSMNLYSATSVSGPWTLVAGQAAGSATVAHTGTAKFFTLRNP
jgi:hypothetical protein